MTKMKKLFAVILALAMLVTMSSFSAFAEGEPVSLTVSPSSVGYNGGMRVSLNVDNNIVGGVQTTITYDKEAVELVSKSVTNTTNNTHVDTILDDGNGNIKVVALGGGVVFEFAVLSTNEKTSVTFAATDVKASNLNGDGYVEVNEAALSATAAISTEETVMPVMIGTRLRKTNNPVNLHLGFTAEIANLGENTTIKEVGLIVIPTALLNGVTPENLTVDTDNVAIAKLEGDEAAAFTKEQFVGYIKNTASTALMGKSFTARYYIILDGSEDIIYSTNFTTSKSGEVTASYGTAKKSAVKQLGMYANKIAANTDDKTIQDGAAQVISDYNTYKSDAEKGDEVKQALINFVFNNRTLIEEYGN